MTARLPFKSTITLEKAFQTTFHSKFSFDDFLSTHASSEIVRITLRKGSSQEATVLSASSKLRRYHRFINKFIFEYAPTNTRVAAAYIAGKNVRSAIEKHAKNKYFFQTDIENFFSSLSVTDIEMVLRNINASPISDLSSHIRQLLDLVTVDDNLPVGFSTSPALSNACMVNFDNSLEAHSNELDITYSRYSDDIILSSRTPENLINITDVLESLLSQEFGSRLQLNKSKTKKSHLGNKVKLLGLVILPNGTISVDSRMKEQIEILFHFYLTDQHKYQDYLRKAFGNRSSQASGRLRYISTVDRNFLRKLRAKYGNLIVDLFLNKP